MPSKPNLPPCIMARSIVLSAAPLPDISRPTSKPSVMPSSRMTASSFSATDIDRARGAELLRQFEPVGVKIGRHDVAGTGPARDGCGHAADWPRAGDQHVLTNEV